jgi:hypothetical protein
MGAPLVFDRGQSKSDMSPRSGWRGGRFPAFDLAFQVAAGERAVMMAWYADFIDLARDGEVRLAA